MNILMAALAVQLLIYAGAWGIVGWKFRIHTEACYYWAVGWLLAGMAALTLYCMPSMVLPPQRLVVNLFVYSGFLALYRGLLAYHERPFRRMVLPWVLIPAVLTELVRSISPDLTGVIALLFALGMTIPLVAGLHLLSLPIVGVDGRRQYVWSNRLMMLPIALLLLVFWGRAAVLLFYDHHMPINFGSGSGWDLHLALGMLLFLGVFNLLLFNLVVGALLHKLRDLSFTDQLTGLANRRVLTERLQQEHERSKRSGKVYAVVAIDLDHFKRINDTHGHWVGDEVLTAVARRLKTCIRGTDMLARTGGEEFMLVLPLADLHGAAVQAMRMQTCLHDQAVDTHAGPLQITASFGVAVFFPDDADTSGIFRRADAALYAAKAAGRNCVRLATA